MNKKKYLIYLAAGILTGLFLLPALVPYSFADLFLLIFGEPNGFNRMIALIICLVIIFSVFRGVFRAFVQK
ncbi:hypothetical protein J27TS8_37000 [Robertmurraya siralis]|uniref:Uncharacterized protein n=1 Tax=Robertmurraya siralis TaxID=77777 RepID=A0A919WL39_9BACI|nr:hypothetical protein [Robertmurraya siralis]PAE21148.1 hypothetical protein CHH80_07655 [Bacillus sp. 7504-2]GIN63707.1 hypothetical protein J27TS8_37000 [Robertmurraya siralis]